ncbi:MAG TPA: hypothetical protein PKH60_03840, partial [Candidatus Woesebacteria bacterium]|nr:hypothetical protein [Candidatus Woesebacteria bacterium]
MQDAAHAFGRNHFGLANQNNHEPEQNGVNSHRLPQRVLVLRSDAKREYFATDDHYLTESFSEENANMIV